MKSRIIQAVNSFEGRCAINRLLFGCVGWARPTMWVCGSLCLLKVACVYLAAWCRSEPSSPSSCRAAPSAQIYSSKGEATVALSIWIHLARCLVPIQFSATRFDRRSSTHLQLYLFGSRMAEHRTRPQCCLCDLVRDWQYSIYYRCRKRLSLQWAPIHQLSAAKGMTRRWFGLIYRRSVVRVQWARMRFGLRWSDWTSWSCLKSGRVRNQTI